MIISRILWTLGWYVVLAAKLFLKIIKNAVPLLRNKVVKRNSCSTTREILTAKKFIVCSIILLYGPVQSKGAHLSYFDGMGGSIIELRFIYFKWYFQH